MWPSDCCFARREFAFITADGVHLRYLSFASAGELAQRLQKTPVPAQIDIGAVYNRSVRYVRYTCVMVMVMRG